MWDIVLLSPSLDDTCKYEFSAILPNLKVYVMSDTWHLTWLIVAQQMTSQVQNLTQNRPVKNLYETDMQKYIFKNSDLT